MQIRGHQFWPTGMYGDTVEYVDISGPFFILLILGWQMVRPTWKQMWPGNACRPTILPCDWVPCLLVGWRWVRGIKVNLVNIVRVPENLTTPGVGTFKPKSNTLFQVPPGSVKCHSWKQLGRGAELLIMHSSKWALKGVGEFQLNGSSSSYPQT